MNSTETQSIGEAIHNSVRLISQVGLEIEALFKILIAEITAAVDSGLLASGVKVSSEWEQDCEIDDSGWVYRYDARSLGLKSPRKKNTERYLVIEAVLDGEGMTHADANNKEPLLHISLWGDPANKADGVFTLLDFTGLDYGVDETFELQHSVLSNWAPKAEDWTKQCWTYSLYLTSVNNADDVKRKIIKPIASLLQNNDAEIAGLPDLDGVVRYEQIGDQQKYRVLGCQKAS